LRAANVNLPQWGFKQIEVTCDKKSKPSDVFSHWNIESHWNERLPPASAADFKSPFWRDFVHLNVAMMTSNNALVPDPDKADELASSAWQWPIAWVGLRMCGWDDHTVKYFLLGNPFVYWSSTAGLLVLGLLALYHILRWQRSSPALSPAETDKLIYAGIYPALGWFLHYIPFFIMGRVLYVHHYFPALWFAILVTGYLSDYFTSRLSKQQRRIVFWTAYALVTSAFIMFAPFTFGMVGNSYKYRHLNWLKSWRVHNGEPISMLQSVASTTEGLVEELVESVSEAVAAAV
jgi:dolichyl-phosphate-mannose-protein mannosyltransferase